jgi:predicted nuclease of restriction endonuclease-like (RecB) superfamily
MTKLTISQDYKDFLIDLKTRIRSAQIKAAHVVNHELIKLYWEMGKSIIERQKATKWGSGFLEQLAKDLRSEFPGMEGFSETNLRKMRRFAEDYPDFLIPQQAAAELEKPPITQLPWGHILVLLDKIKPLVERNWYAAQTFEHGWSRSVLSMHIKTDLYERQGKPENKISNFKERLPSPQSDLAEQSLKNPYLLDFLTIGKDAHEREIEKELTQHIEKFLLELGTGFAFVGRQIPLHIGDKDFKLDMLFYHLKLRCYVVIEIKAREFKPIDAGQLNFYLSAVDDHYKEEIDGPTIGILLCESQNRIIAEYALRDISKPMGVSEYRNTKLMPKEFKKNLPTIEELEAEFKEIEGKAPRKPKKPGRKKKSF